MMNSEGRGERGENFFCCLFLTVSKGSGISMPTSTKWTCSKSSDLMRTLARAQTSAMKHKRANVFPQWGDTNKFTKFLELWNSNSTLLQLATPRHVTIATSQVFLWVSVTRDRVFLRVLVTRVSVIRHVELRPHSTQNSSLMCDWDPRNKLNRLLWGNAFWLQKCSCRIQILKILAQTSRIAIGITNRKASSLFVFNQRGKRIGYSNKKKWK